MLRSKAALLVGIVAAAGVAAAGPDRVVEGAPIRGYEKLVEFLSPAQPPKPMRERTVVLTPEAVVPFLRDASF